MKMTTKLVPHQEFPVVQTWWDRGSRNYISQLKDVEGNQIGDALFAGVPHGAKANHRELVNLMMKMNKQKSDEVIRAVRI